MDVRARGSRGALRACVALALALALCGCSSLSIKRDTETSGTYRSRAWAFTIISIDMPSPALEIARENIADTRLVNLKVDKVKVTPSNPWIDWFFDIIGIRVATITGTWGFSGQT